MARRSPFGRLASVFRRSSRLGPLLLGLWLIWYGLTSFVAIPFGTTIAAVLAIVTGVVVLLER
jgi:hypothetical protein